MPTFVLHPLLMISLQFCYVFRRDINRDVLPQWV